MGYTIQQQRIVQRVADMLIQQRENTRITCVSLKNELDSFSGIDALTLAKAQSFASNLRNVLNTLQNNQAVILAAADALDPDTDLRVDFTSRFTQLDDACSALEGANSGNISNRLTTIINNLPQEPLV